MSSNTPEQEVIRLKEQLNKLYDILGWNPDEEPIEMADLMLHIRDLEIAGKQKDCALETALDALETAENGLHWYQDHFPQVVTGCDHEANADITAAITAVKTELGNTK